MTSSYDPIYYNLVDNNKSRKDSNDTSQTQTPNNEIGYDDDPFTIFCEIDVNSSWNIDQSPKKICGLVRKSAKLL